MLGVMYVAGSFLYSPPAGTLLSVGNNQALTVMVGTNSTCNATV